DQPADQGTMTIQGTATKTIGLVAMVVVAGAWTWYQFVSHGQNQAAVPYVLPWLWGGIIGGMILGLVTVFKQSWSPITAPLYALFEGLALGGISAFFETRFPGIAFQAVVLTVSTL